MSNIQVSVIVPTFNRNKQLQQCLSSLFNQLLLTVNIIVINNSNNFNLKYLKNRNIASYNLLRKKLMYLSEKNLGVSFCRNKGISEARGEILAFIDDDCIADNNWIKTIINTARKFKNSIIVGENHYGNNNSIISLVQYLRAKRVFGTTRYFKNGMNYCRFIDTKNFAIPRALIEKHHLTFDTKSGFVRYSACEDLDFSLQVQTKRIPIVYQPKMVVTHQDSTLFNFLKREFTKGRAFYHFIKKWPSYTPKKSKLMFFLGIINEPLVQKRKLIVKLATFFLFTFTGGVYRMGILVEAFLIKFNYFKTNKK